MIRLLLLALVIGSVVAWLIHRTRRQGLPSLLPVVPAHERVIGGRDFASMVIEASQTTPVLAVFSMPDCRHCRTFAPVASGMARELDGRVLLAKVDAVAEAALAQAHRVRRYPTGLLFRGGAVVAQFDGALGLEELREFLRAFGIEGAR